LLARVNDPRDEGLMTDNQVYHELATKM
jgi:hypothetical protein